jgi:hypothetical protein
MMIKGKQQNFLQFTDPLAIVSCKVTCNIVSFFLRLVRLKE